MREKCGRRGLEIASYKKNGAQSASYLWSGKFFRAHLLFVLNVIFAGPLKENEQRKKMA